ncbi:MAG: GNAT family N-acetyltransferase [Acidobacteria bacterium]|nr:GNAT family N-acetyltransferase [Acidobacteriota bacterium]
MTQIEPLHLPTPSQDAVVSGRLILRDGSAATLRPSRPEDGPALEEFFHRLSPVSRRRRFFSDAEPRPALLRTFCDSGDPRRQLTLLVWRTIDAEERTVAAGSYIVQDGSSAEVAFAVDDRFQGKGLGTLLLERLALVAMQNGIERFWAVTEAENKPMLDVFRESGFAMRSTLDDGVVDIDLSVAPSQASVTFAELRDRIATEASLRPFFQPRSIAVVGASRDPAGIGHRIVEAIVANRFNGPVYPINPAASVIRCLKAYPSVRAVPEPVDLAIVAVPRESVLDVVDDCAARAVKALVVITAGFAEVSGPGEELQRQLHAKVRGYGMRMVGPNCMGLLNTDPAVSLNASFSPVFPPAGPVALLSQSGALGIAILSLARERQLGLSTFVSVGNKGDVSGNDLLQYWEGDPRTSVILLYLESFGNPRRFARIARRISRVKPIVAVKAGRTLAGRRAAGSHTAALAAADTAVDALLRQTGVIRAETLDEMFQLAACLADQPLPSGRRVGIVTNAGGPGILCVDACESSGLQVGDFTDGTRSRLASFLPSAAATSNPVDMIASATPEQYRQAIETVLAADEVDSLIVIYTPVDSTNLPAVVAAIGDGVAAARGQCAIRKPVLACLMGDERGAARLGPPRERIPVYEFPEAAARALGKVAAYAEWRAEPPGIVPALANMSLTVAREICRRALAGRGEGWLSNDETRQVLTAAGLRLPEGGVATTADEAATLATAIGFPVAVKLASHRIVHKSDVGGVHLGLADAEAARHAFDEIRRALIDRGAEDAMDGVVVQSMLTKGVELMVGVAEDPLFGPLIAFGLGGVHVEVLGDVRFRVTPLTDRDAAQMVKEIRGYPLLQGYRGHPPADLEAVVDVLLRVSRLVEELPEITELDLNPVFAFGPGDGCQIVDARIHVATPSAKQPMRYTTTVASP